GRPLQQIHVALGQLSDVSPESLTFYFDLLRQGTPAAAATLLVRREPGRATCQACGQESSIGPDDGCCPVCGSTRLRVTAGDRLLLEAVDVED
ncbi:MAG: hydrogenase maturation nickel metallochaperone HypA, partial [Chloroflexota bacterium]